MARSVVRVGRHHGRVIRRGRGPRIDGSGLRCVESAVPDGDFADLAVEEAGVPVAGADVPVRIDRKSAGRVRAACEKRAVAVEVPVRAVVRADEVDPLADVFRGDICGDKVVAGCAVPAPELVRIVIQSIVNSNCITRPHTQ